MTSPTTTELKAHYLKKLHEIPTTVMYDRLATYLALIAAVIHQNRNNPEAVEVLQDMIASGRYFLTGETPMG